MSFTTIAMTAALIVSCAVSAAAQTVRVEFRNGRVTLNAQNAPVRTILAEWARVGGTRVVNGERVTGAPLTLELNNVPERQALDIILRNVSGYMAGPRLAAASATSSSFDRIMILPTTAPAAPPARLAAAPVFTPPPPQIPQIDPDDPEENPVTDTPPGVPTPPNGGRGVRFQPPRGRGNIPVAAQPFPPQVQPDPDDEPQQGVQPTPANPFGITPGSARPGVITPVPQQPPQNGRPNGDPEP